MDIKDAVYVLQLHEEEDLIHHQRSHKHDENCFEVHFFLEGEGTFRVGKCSYSIRGGSFFVIKGSIDHKITAQRNSALSYYAILMKYDIETEKLVDDLQKKGSIKISLKDRFLFEEIKEKGLSSNKELRLSSCYQLLSFLYAVNNEYKNNGVRDSSLTNISLAKATSYFEKHIFDYITLEDVANYVKLDSSYLVRLFSKNYHISPMKYYHNLKMEAAKNRLCTTTFSIKEISAELKFCNEFYFSKKFKERYGISPSKYRLSHIELIGKKKIDL